MLMTHGLENVGRCMQISAAMKKRRVDYAIIGHVILVAINEATILVPSHLCQATATHWKMGYP